MTHVYKLNYAINNRLPQSSLDSIQNETVPLFDFGYIGTVLLLLLGLYILSSLLSFVTGYIMSGVAQKTVFDMRSDVKDKLDKLSLKYYDGRTNGEILSRVTNDMDTVANTLQQSMTQLITSAVTIIGILIMMLSISPVMTLIALVTLPVSAIFMVVVIKNSQKYFTQQQREIGALNGHVEEMFTGHKAVKVFGHEKESIAGFEEINDRYYDVGWKAQFVSGLTMPALGFVSDLGYVLVCITGGVLVAKKTLEVGDVPAFIQYMRSFTMPIVQTANIANIIQSTIAAAERVFEVLDEEEEVPESENPMPMNQIRGDVAFEHVRFGYSPDNILMEDISIKANAGETVAIVGPTGAGKTTMINLLMRFYEINGGKIMIDGVDIRDMRRQDLRKQFGMVLQDTWLFNGTILDNIRYGNTAATDEAVYKAAKSARADHFIRALPEGYHTILNEEASNISQGQKQLLTIARALLTDPKILILDEATSNVDTRTEVLIQEAMDRLMRGRTSFVIAHRLSTVKNADLILVMNKGTIIEQGNQEQLIAAKGFYADLYNSQFSDED
jgi:ATP-binding cassette subfamily B protein